MNDFDVSEYRGMILSYGAGVNSTALAILLINNGWKGDIVFADTGTEWPDTYCFMDYFESGWLKPRELEIIRLGAEWRRDINKPSLIDFCTQKCMIPIMAQRWCTDRYKLKPIAKFMKEYNIVGDLVGIDAGERHRAITKIRPLVDWGIGRDDCIGIVENEALSIPRKSGCYICPFQSDVQWRTLYEQHPDLYARAEELEKQCNIKKRKESWKPVAIDIRGITLEQKRTAFESQMTLPNIDMDSLLKYKPCICGI